MPTTMIGDYHLMMRMGITWWGWVSPDEDDCLIHWMMILTSGDHHLLSAISGSYHPLMEIVDWWLTLNNEYHDEWVSWWVSIMGGEYHGGWISWVVSIMGGEYHDRWVVPSDDTRWVVGDYHGQCPSSSGDYHYHMIIILRCPSSGDDYYLAHGYHLMMTVTWCEWLSPDVDDCHLMWMTITWCWCHLMMMGIMGDENHSNDYHWAMSTNGWWESPSDEDLHWWWLPLRVKITDCWHTHLIVTVIGWWSWSMAITDECHLPMMVTDYLLSWLMNTTEWWLSLASDGHLLATIIHDKDLLMRIMVGDYHLWWLSLWVTITFDGYREYWKSSDAECHDRVSTPPWWSSDDDEYQWVMAISWQSSLITISDGWQCEYFMGIGWILDGIKQVLDG